MSRSTRGRGGLLEKDKRKLLAIKPKSSVPNRVKSIIKVITINHDNVIPFGSWTYKAQLYPGDIDLIEEETSSKTREAAKKYFGRKFRGIIHRILNLRGFYLGDIKMGEDLWFKIDLGVPSFDANGQWSLFGYIPEKIHADLLNLYNKNLLSEDETEELIELASENPTQLEYETLYDKLRDLWLLRWTGEEVLRGYKELRGNRRIKVSDVIAQPVLTKIDMWAEVNGRFLEITNVLAFSYHDADTGHQEMLNYSGNPKQIAKELKQEVQKYAFSKLFFKPFKMAKRMWSLARITDDIKTIEKLTPFLQSDIGRLSQINSEIEVLIDMLEHIRTPPLAAMLKQIDFFTSRLANIYEIDFNEEGVDRIIKKILERKKNTSVNRRYIVKMLTGLKDYFTSLIKNHTIEYLTNIGLYPPPPKFLPHR